MANPYHDKEGKFTSKGNEGRAEPKAKETTLKASLKSGVDLNSIFSFFDNFSSVQSKPTQPTNVATGIIDTNFQLTLPTDINDAINQGNRILGSSAIVNYANDTNLEQAFEMNKGLMAVVSEFPKLFEDNLLIGFGTASRSDISEFDWAKEKQTIDNIYNKPEYNEVKLFLAQNGVDFRNIRNAFIGVVKNSSRMYNFERDTSTQGITKGRAATLKRVNMTFSAPDAVQINPRNMRHDIQTSISKLQSAINNGSFFSYGDKTPTFATTVHELGHHCHNQLSGLMNDNERAQFNFLTRNKAKLHYNGEISGYAASSREEMVAEAFSDYFCRGKEATSHNKQIVNFFKGVYDRIYGTK